VGFEAERNVGVSVARTRAQNGAVAPTAMKCEFGGAYRENEFAPKRN